ncbi:MAG: glycosyltransferase family protein [Solirubrobacteraceae bacterium]
MSQVTNLPGRHAVRKVLLYSHDTYGLGHIRRNLAIAHNLLAHEPGIQIVLLTGSVVSDRFELPPRLSVVRLPAVVKDGPESYRPVDTRLTLGVVRRARTAVITDVARRLAPDVLLVDHAPAGMGGELREVFEMLERERPGTRVVLGLRDVLDEPETVLRTWSTQGIHELLEDAYDEIYVYGQRYMFDVGAAYRMRPELRARLRYTGYLDRGPVEPADSAPISPPYLLATAGGGGDGAAVLNAALDAGGRLGLATLLVTGPLIDARQRAALDARVAATPRARVLTFHPNVGSLMRSAAVVVTMGGYNSLCEAVGSGTPTIVVPRTWPRREQEIRASLFADRGLVDVVAQGPDLADRLAPVIRERLRGRPALQGLDLGGLDRLAHGLLLRASGDAVPVAEELAA